MGRRLTAVAVVVALAAPVFGLTASAEGPQPVGSVVAVSGPVQVGRDGAWQPAAAQQQLFEGQAIRSGEGSRVEILFEGSLPAVLEGKGEIAVADLLLRARLEKARAKIAAPGSGAAADMQVTPLTGVRGTEKAEEKAGDLKRDHYWNEGAPAAK